LAAQRRLNGSSAGYLIGGSPNNPILIIRRLDFRHKAYFFEIPPPKF
jgi:hypothetical protein